MPGKFIYLASQSPRRAELLRQLGVSFEVVSAPIDESLQAGESPNHYVLRLAQAKAKAALASLGGKTIRPLLAADTAVMVDGRILGKPHDRADGLAMLARLSGRTHQVLSAIALWTPDGLHQASSTSTVTFRTITSEEAAAYWETGEPADKAGAYAIQGRGAVFVSHLDGSYSGVMGLPLYETAQLLRSAGVPVLGGDHTSEEVRK
ncbi:MAG: Maf family protein [Gammaproteobacteria bacterium]